MQPTSRVYRTVVPTEARKSINHFSRNITYPGRLINNVLQGRWQGCRRRIGAVPDQHHRRRRRILRCRQQVEHPEIRCRFQPDLLHLGLETQRLRHAAIPRSQRRPERDGLHRRPRHVALVLPRSHALRGLDHARTYNRLSDRTEPTAQFIKAESDSYVGAKYLWTYASKDESPDWETTGPKDPSTLQTLGVAMIQTKDRRFIEKGREMSVRLPSTGRKMKYNLWLQRDHAPLAIVSPGLGSHRVSNATLSLAEALYNDGFTVVTIAGIFHPEFMENASTSALPAYPPNDCRDLLVLMTEIDHSLEKKFPGRIGKKALVGFSMGGFQALHLAANEKSADPGLLRFDRYVSIDNPVDLHYGDRVIDGFCNAADAWPADTRQARANNAVHKATKLIGAPPEMLANPPFDATESKFLVGTSFRLTLRDTIFCSQSRNDMGVLTNPTSSGAGNRSIGKSTTSPIGTTSWTSPCPTINSAASAPRTSPARTISGPIPSPCAPTKTPASSSTATISCSAPATSPG